MMNRFIEHIGNLYSIILTILTLFLGEHWILFMVLLLLNIIDTLTGWIKSRINNNGRVKRNYEKISSMDFSIIGLCYSSMF